MGQTLWSAAAGDVPTPLNTNGGLDHLTIDQGNRNATAAAGAVTLNKMSGVITTEALATAAGAEYVLTLTNTNITYADQVYASVGFVSSTTGTPVVTRIQQTAVTGNPVQIHIQNVHATAPFNGTLEINFFIVKY